MPSNKQSHTIFLTPEEDERVRKAFKDRVQKCRLLEGQPRQAGDPKYRQNQVATASLLSDISSIDLTGTSTSNGSSDAIVTYAVGNIFPPCTLSLNDLQPMKFSDLRMDTHHRGYVLTVKRIAPVVKLVACSWTIVQEESSEEMERLEVTLHKFKLGQEILETASMFKIKEPYFTLNDQGEPTIRTDHPSDLFVYPADLPLHGPDFCTERNEPAIDIEAARKFKEDGNAALKQKNLALAHSNYTQGLQIVKEKNATKEDLTHDLFRNRAHVNLVLTRFDEAKTDALTSVTGIGDEKYMELNGKAYSRAGYAAYNLGEFQEAKRFFGEQKRLLPGNKEAAAYIRKTELRLQEQATGNFDFTKIKAALATGGSRVDAASFTQNVTVKDSPGCGRGLFATRNIGLREIVICEKPFCAVLGKEDESLTAMTYDNRDDRIRVFPAGLCKAIVQKISNNPSQIEKVLDLYGDYPGIGKQLLMRDATPVIDTFQVQDIVLRNAFGLNSLHTGGEEDVKKASTGLWILAAYANHSCVPNTEKESIGDLLVLRATRAIRAGDEITHSYDASSDYDTRAASLMNTWGFICTCELCIAEKNDGPELRKKRRDLETQVDVFVEKEAAIGAKRLSIVKARRLAQSIKNTYDDEKYKDLPRTALLKVNKWLAEASAR